MHVSDGQGWRITMDTSGPMLIALYLRDVAGLDGAGKPSLSHADPKVRHADHSHLTSDVGGINALKTEWEAWWESLVKSYPKPVSELEPPSFKAFGNSPALQRVLQAHFGSALGWATDRIDEYARLEAERAASGLNQVLSEMVEDRLLEVGRSSRDFDLTIIELPLNEPRAWYLEPDTMIMSHRLMSQPEAFRSYVQPVVEMLA
ncbi:hypothetical protein CVCC1112_563 [Paenarthrobacter nicotinovorans]|uniref:hypothetical protein n=1 Tax=Paenarthrobacter nicotinovorans TaxID=29320 RepID=UPI00057F85EA|nr:hypothetical protein [Paenarthrobacter nicotinovorans]KIA72330.1 hypothetical protein ANMWB30_30540 [Arthrobacter sp. MWB30]GAT85903.1 hypothetical protein CVCC1112_563 [Paenarthrobacter nicotinovorans]